MKTNEKDIPHPYLEYMTDDVKDQCYYGTRPQVISNDFREYVWAYYTLSLIHILMRTKDMLKKAISTALEADRSHYDLLIYRINKATEIE